MLNEEIPVNKVGRNDVHYIKGLSIFCFSVNSKCTLDEQWMKNTLDFF